VETNVPKDSTVLKVYLVGKMNFVLGDVLSIGARHWGAVCFGPSIPGRLT